MDSLLKGLCYCPLTLRRFGGRFSANAVSFGGGSVDQQPSAGGSEQRLASVSLVGSRCWKRCDQGATILLFACWGGVWPDIGGDPRVPVGGPLGGQSAAASLLPSRVRATRMIASSGPATGLSAAGLSAAGGGGEFLFFVHNVHFWFLWSGGAAVGGGEWEKFGLLSFGVAC